MIVYSLARNGCDLKFLLDGQEIDYSSASPDVQELLDSLKSGKEQVAELEQELAILGISREHCKSKLLSVLKRNMGN